MIDVRCPRCNALLFRADNSGGKIEIKCNKCKSLLEWPSNTPAVKAGGEDQPGRYRVLIGENHGND